MAGAQSGESSKSLVGRDPIATRLDGQGRVGGIWNEVPGGVTGAQQLLDNGPVPGTGPDGNRVWLTAALLDDIPFFFFSLFSFLGRLCRLPRSLVVS
jgi:hypothetical protein